MRIIDVNSPVRNAKSQKLSEEWNSDEGRNRIGNLPEGILLHILSFLPTKDSVKTSILSKRWQYLWMSVTNLEFRGRGDEDERMLFMNFVERVLLLRDPSNIQKFSLSCDASLNESRVNAWISAAVRHKVKALDLYFHDVCESSVLPCSLFTSESLTLLELDMFDDLVLPSAICFSSLKIMWLKHVTFWDHHSPGRLFSGCPVLEKLTLDECDWTNVKSVSISAPMLKSLTIFESEDDENNCEVVIIGTCLQSFDYGGELKNDYCFHNSSLLVDAYMNVGKISAIEKEGRQREVVDRAHKLLKGLSNIRVLILTYDTVKVLNYAEELLAHLPMFYNLTFLKLTAGSVNFASGALMKLLQNSPSLNTMQCLQGISLIPYGENYDWTLDPIPPCFSSHFKTIEICDFYGTQEELDVIKSLLKSATALEKMCLTFVGGLKEEHDFFEQLDMFPSERLDCLCIHDDPKKGTSLSSLAKMFWDHQSPGRLFSGCPVLEKLILDECDWTYVNCEVVIIGTCLQSFDYRGALKKDYCLCNSSSLVDACIDLYEIWDIEKEGIQREVAERTHKLLRGLYTARDLILASATFETTDETTPKLAFTEYYEMCGGKFFTTADFVVALGISLTPYGEKDKWIFDPVPLCFSQNFKSITIWNFHGTQKEVDVMKNLLKTATALEKMCLIVVGGV